MNLKRVGKILGIVVVVLVVLVGGLFAVGILGVPDAGLENNEWGEVEEDRIEVLTTVWVDNPNPFGIGGEADVEYEIELEGVELAAGEGTDISVSSGENQLEFSTDLRQQRIPAWWSAHLNNDELSELGVDATVHASAGPFSGSPSGSYSDEVETDIEGALDEAFSEFEGEYSATGEGVSLPDGMAVEPTIEITETTTEWGEIDENSTEILLTVDIHNPNAYPIPTPAFTGELEMNELTMAQWDADDVEVRDAGEDAIIAPQSTEQRMLVVVMDNDNIPPWLGTHVDRNEFSDVVISGQLALSINGEQMTIPQQGDAIQCEYDLTTSIFVDQESGMDRDGCGLTPVETTEDELEAAGATLDLTKTDWWDEDGNGLLDGLSEGEDEGDDDDSIIPEDT